MDNKTIKNILEEHHIEYMEINGYIVALEHYTNTNGSAGINFVDVTGWTVNQLLTFLGY